MITHNKGMEIYESTMKQLTLYIYIEISEKQIEAGQVKDARNSTQRNEDKDKRIIAPTRQMVRREVASLLVSLFFGV